MRTALVIVFLLLVPRPGRACSVAYRSMFQLFDDAAVVARVKLRSGTDQTEFAVVTPLKGSPGKTLVVDAALSSDAGSHGDCKPGRHASGIVFVAAKGDFEGAYDAYPYDTKALVDTLTAWSTASTPAERATVLVNLIASGDKDHDGDDKLVLIRDATELLVDDPALATAITTAQRDALAAALPKVSREIALPLLLARIGTPDLEALLPADFGARDALAYAAERKFESVTSTDELATVLAATPNGPSMRASAAFERCERVRGVKLGSLHWLVRTDVNKSPNNWRDDAIRCRTGQWPPEESLPDEAIDDSTPAARRAELLVGILVGSDRDRDVTAHDNIVYGAAGLLARRPELIDAITPAQRDRLVAAMPRMYRSDDLSFLLARLGVTVPDDYPDRVAARALVDARAFEDVTSADALADAIAKTKGGAAAAGVAAFERCERVWGHRLSWYSLRRAIDNGMDWKGVARLCRSGKPE